MLDKQKYLVFLPAVAFILILVAGFGTAVASLRSAPSAGWVGMDEPEKMVGGESTRRLSNLLHDHFLLNKPFNQIERGTAWLLTGDWGPRVRPGCPDWLFLTDELEVHVDRKNAAAARTKLASRLAARLNERGVKLLLVVVPDKSRIEKAHLCQLNRSLLLEHRIENWVGGLKTAGVDVLDLTPALLSMPGERYYRTDTHWNEAGADAAAQAIVSVLRARGLATDADAVFKPSSTKPSSTKPLGVQRIERSGDLIRVAGLDGLPGFLRPKPELTQSTVVAPVAVLSDDLFGDEALPRVALIGTSYSRSANFLPFLAQYLGTPVANLAKEGGDFDGAATAYFSGATYRQSPPKVVIWEVPERIVEMPIKDSERKWLENLMQD